MPSELNAAYLWAQLEKADEITEDRMNSWNAYYEQLAPLQKKEKLFLPYIPKKCTHNAHMFFVKAKDLDERTELIVF